MKKFYNHSILLLFSLTLLLSAGLIFWVEPLAAKMLLPYLGGAPQVWNTAMMFFQGALLLGYLYAHFLSKIPLKLQTFIHLILLLAGILFLPMVVSQHWQANDLSPIHSLLTQLTFMIGLPLIVLSANAPLLQSWFSLSKHPHSHDPYFLYSASNLGSMLALISFPLLLEPTFTLTQQSHLWQFIYYIFIFLIFCCCFALIFLLQPVNQTTIYDQKSSSPTIKQLTPITWIQKIHWLLLAFAPSSLLLGVTTHLTTDIAAIPLFWVIPLALYLLTFIIVFSRKPILSHHFNLTWQYFTLIPFFFLISLPFLTENIWIAFIINLLAFFFAALVCHGELVKNRPPSYKLTEFYLWIAIGGLCGGIFNAIIAPKIFNLVVEYPIAMAIALMLRPSTSKTRTQFNWLDIILPLICGLLIFILSQFFDSTSLKTISYPFALIFAGLSLLFFSFPERPIRLGLGLGILMLSAIYFLNPYQSHLLIIKRNFFGTTRVAENKNDTVHILLHGTTMHGIQFMQPEKQKIIRAYYEPLRSIIDSIDQKYPVAKIGIAGLGGGTLACYARPNDQFTFYEIDMDMIKIAKNPKYFTYLKLCPAKGGIILGDARIEIKKALPHFYNAIILDAFSSDAIPVHLMTTEAVQLYLSKLSNQGLIIFNVTNRNLNLIPVLTGIANQLHLVGLMRIDNKPDWKNYKFGSHWVVLARTKQDFGNLISNPKWQPLPTHTSARPWTDNYSDIWGVFI